MQPRTPPNSPLVNHLKQHSPEWYGKLAGIRGEIERWLTYVPQTFGHYTSHTIDHSDEIVLQISKVLFPEGTQDPVVDMGPIATYILIVTAYLHDAGMVTSEHEKEELLASEEWRDWTTEGGAKKRWSEILVRRSEAGKDPLKHFACDRATRLLIAEYIRRRHHYRAGDLIRGRALSMVGIDVGDPMLGAAIADICVAHGLDRRDIEDSIRFPESRDILGERVKLRFLATLLRLGDLLDLRTERACPLLMHAACPLPADSVAHWDQYRGIYHRLTTPEQIQIGAICHSPDEHRVLHDWCNWLVEEVKSIPARLPTMKWWPPRATMDGGDPTIKISPAPDAGYIPGDWHFELDQEAILQRLITDVYSRPEDFLRELIQNALDATRCQMYLDLQAAGYPVPESPTDVPADLLNRYEITIELREEVVANETTGESERVYFVSVDDPGIGMDLSIIRHHLLQIGRSYYTTAEFRHKFPFHPTSRFGIGFLSVFAVSDDVTIETYRHSQPQADGGLRLRLTGPRNYILIERSKRARHGTRVEVRLKKALTNTLNELVRFWCMFVEFPFRVIEHGATTTVLQRSFQKLHMEHSDLRYSSIRYVRRVHELHYPGIRGAFVAMARIENEVERWIAPQWGLPYFGADRLHEDWRSIFALHGIVVNRSHSQRLMILLDIRRRFDVDLSRRVDTRAFSALPEVQESLTNVITSHLGDDSGGFSMQEWRYRTQLLSDDEIIGTLPLWKTRRDMVPVWRSGVLEGCSLNDLLSEGHWYISRSRKIANRLEAAPDELISRALPADVPLVDSHLFFLSLRGEQILMRPLLSGSAPVSVVQINSEEFVLECRVGHSGDIQMLAPDEFIVLHDAPTCHFDLARWGGVSGWLVVNGSTEFGRWYRQIVLFSKQGKIPSVEKGRLDRILWSHDEWFSESLQDWNAYHANTPEFVCPNTKPVSLR